jgi:hypothetical protein
MQRIEPFNSPANRLRFDSLLSLVRSFLSKVASAARLTRRHTNDAQSPPDRPALKVAGYALVLMDGDGQVVWNREWDAGGVFEFGPRQRLFVFCGFTNYSGQEAEISEYEVELMGEDGAIVKRFNSSFGDLLVIPPGESKHFSAEWRM